MTETERAVMKQALVVLRGCLDNPDAEDAIAALNAALAQPAPQQEKTE